MYAKLLPHELAERLATKSTGVSRSTGLPEEWEYYPLQRLIKDWLMSKGYEEEPAEIRRGARGRD